MYINLKGYVIILNKIRIYWVAAEAQFSLRQIDAKFNPMPGKN